MNKEILLKIYIKINKLMIKRMFCFEKPLIVINKNMIFKVKMMIFLYKKKKI